MQCPPPSHWSAHRQNLHECREKAQRALAGAAARLMLARLAAFWQSAGRPPDPVGAPAGLGLRTWRDEVLRPDGPWRACGRSPLDAAALQRYPCDPVRWWPHGSRQCAAPWLCSHAVARAPASARALVDGLAR